MKILNWLNSIASLIFLSLFLFTIIDYLKRIDYYINYDQKSLILIILSIIGSILLLIYLMQSIISTFSDSEKEIIPKSSMVLTVIAFIISLIAVIYLWILSLSRPLDDMSGIVVAIPLFIISIPLIGIALLVYFVQYFRNKNNN